tara:strand:- start:3538 stop:3717 length:180 start_codon:yes stop_codon:yes gene_type:complete
MGIIFKSITTNGADSKVLSQNSVNGSKVSFQLECVMPGSYIIITQDIAGTNHLGVLIVH